MGRYSYTIQHGSHRDIEYVHGVISIWNVDVPVNLPKPTKLEHRNLIQTIGLDQDLDKLDYDDSRWICLDVPNGYTERFNDFVGLT